MFYCIECFMLYTCLCVILIIYYRRARKKYGKDDIHVPVSNEEAPHDEDEEMNAEGEQEESVESSDGLTCCDGGDDDSDYDNDSE